MRKSFHFLLILGLLVGAMLAPAEAAKKKKKVTRKVTATYQLPGFGTASASAGCSPALGSCGNFSIGPKEKYAKITLTDATGSPVAFDVAQDTEPGDTTNTIETNHGTFCGTTGKKAIKILPGYEMTIFVWAWGDAVCPTGVGTTGTINAQFSNLP